MMLLLKYLTVYLISIIELWVAVPTGLAFKLDPLLIVVCSATGASTGAFLVVLIGEPLRKWLLKFKRADVGKPDAKIKKIWDRYGIPGLCLIAPFLTGAHIGAAIGVTLGGNKKVIMTWTVVSCFLWATLFTFAGAAGVSLFSK